jgi:hypothetical protein
MATPIKLEDRGSNWSITYDDGGFDTVPKDPNVIDTAAAAADMQGQKELAAKFRMWAQNIRTKGVPVIITPVVLPLILITGAALLGVWAINKVMK